MFLVIRPICSHQYLIILILDILCGWVISSRKSMWNCNASCIFSIICNKMEKINLAKKVNSSLKVILSVGMGFMILFVFISGIVFFSKSIIGNLIPYLSIFLSIFIIYFGIEKLNKKTFNSTLMSLGSKIGNPKSIGVFPYVTFGIITDWYL